MTSYGKTKELEVLLSQDITGEATGARSVVSAAVAILKRLKIGFAAVGGFALGLRGSPRFTSDLDLVVEPERWKEVVRAFRSAGFKPNPEGPGISEFMARFVHPKSHFGVDLLFAVGDPEESAREMATEERIFGTKIPVARTEFLLWMYLLSDDPQHFADATRLVKGGLVDVKKVARMLREAGDDAAYKKLARVMLAVGRSQ